MKTSDFHFELPEALIARHPVEPRDHARLLVVDRARHTLSHHRFDELSSWIGGDDLLVLNNTRVIHARLLFPGNVEVLLLKETSPLHWVAIGRPSKKLQPGDRLALNGAGEPLLEVLRTLPDGTRVIRFFSEPDLEVIGQLPLPPYIIKSRLNKGEAEYTAQDREEYQTVYASRPGSVAAPTAGLHFTPELLGRFQYTFLTLDIGMGTFRPVKCHELKDHVMHEESYEIPEGLKDACSAARRVVAVGTTVCRVLESRPQLAPGPGTTSIFIHPPYRFRRTDALITNFHLPGSTLLMLVCAFGGYDLMMQAYEEAVREEYRFFSYGDAMLIL
ncbi:MAG: tRNA preQ1(34) S-adenosylmethionine ribosyltransferase-isomerase QueA [Candidatus Methylacidiphilales bacterium]